jgi:transcriptional regulator with PAS, ATPase and Fis domain
MCDDACPLRYTIETGRSISNHRVHVTDAHGRSKPVSISTSLLRDPRGEIVGAVETFRDLSIEETLRKEIRDQYTFQDIVSKSPKMRRIFEVLPTVARTDTTVLIEGETGTGKELLARAIHSLSHRRQRRLVTVNCGALPDSLLESELFGYRSGAFTGANRDKPGKISAAHKGTLFLDEVGEMSQALQMRLLRVLQEKVIEPLGSVTSTEADVRVIAATHHDLSRDVEEGSFREDLFYRLNVFPVQLPPLRDRKEDIPLLVDHFLARFSASLGREIRSVSPEVTQVLVSHEYPGNVRELQSVLEHACILCHDGVLGLEHLPTVLQDARRRSRGGLTGQVLEHEARLIWEALERNEWHREAAARDLGIHKATLYKKIRKMGIELPATDGRSRGASAEP